MASSWRLASRASESGSSHISAGQRPARGAPGTAVQPRQLGEVPGRWHSAPCQSLSRKLAVRARCALLTYRSSLPPSADHAADHQVINLRNPQQVNTTFSFSIL